MPHSMIFRWVDGRRSAGIEEPMQFLATNIFLYGRWREHLEEQPCVRSLQKVAKDPRSHVNSEVL